MARITGRIDAGKETRLDASIQERPPGGKSVKLTCSGCGRPFQIQGGISAWNCPKCGGSMEPDSAWFRRPGEVRIRAVPPISQLDAEPPFRRDGDALVGNLDARLLPLYDSDFDLAPYLPPDFDGPIDGAVPGDIGLIFHLPPGEADGSSGARDGHRSRYSWGNKKVRIRGTEAGYRITVDGRVIPLSEYPLPVWRFTFRIVK